MEARGMPVVGQFHLGPPLDTVPLGYRTVRGFMHSSIEGSLVESSVDSWIIA